MALAVRRLVIGPRALGVLASAFVAGAACTRGTLLEARVAAAADSEATLDTLHDYEIGEIAAASRVADLEALLAESRSDPRVLLLLARAWCRLTFAFTLDQHERALEIGDAALAAYHASRARAGFERAAHFADRWLEERAPGYSRALGDGERLTRFLAGYGRDAAEALLWAGVGRVGDAALAADAARSANARRDGASLLRRSLELDPERARGLAHLALAVEAASRPDPELDVLRAELDRAAAASRGKRLFVRVLRARTLACLARDPRAFEAELDQVLSSGDLDPGLRLENAAAKRRARMYLTSRRLHAGCFDAARD